MSKRRKARELALRASYALEMSGNPVDKIIEEMLLFRPEEEKVKQFAIELLKKSVEHKRYFDDIISDKAFNWEFERIAILDKLIMRIAICEFLYFEDIPPKVSIDEAIEIAKKYSTENSGKFINGILDGILMDLKTKGLLNKSGRGLDEG
ncbi:MAG: transcription antitermination factor NusB [bacterium]